VSNQDSNTPDLGAFAEQSAAAVPPRKPPKKLTKAVEDLEFKLRQVEQKIVNAEFAVNNAKADSKAHFQSLLNAAQLARDEVEHDLTQAKQEIEEWLAEKQSASECEDRLLNGIVNPFGQEEYSGLVEQFGFPIHEGPRDIKLNEAFWGSAFLRDKEILYSPNHKEFYEYEPFTGLYHIRTEDNISFRLNRYLLSLSRDASLEAQLGFYFDTAFLNKATKRQRGIREDSEAFMRRCTQFAHVANGVLEFNEHYNVRLCEFSSKYKSLNSSPIPFDANATCPEFLHCISHISPDDIDLLQRMSGLFLLGRNIAQKIFLFEGPGNTFKSTFAEIIQNILGIENCTELRVKHLNERFELYRYFQKNLLVGSDVMDNFLLSEEASFLKKMTGDDLLEAEKKNSNDGFQIRGNFNILITSNSRLLLQLQQDATAWKRRLVLIPWTPVQRERNIPEFAKQIVRKEGSGILNWVIEGAQKLLRDRDTGEAFRTTPEQAARVNDRIDESDSLSKFLQFRAVKSKTGTLRTAEIGDAYILYCHEKNWVAYSEETLERRLPELMASLFGAPRSNHVRGSSVGFPGRGYQRVEWRLPQDNGSDGPKRVFEKS